MQKHDAARLLFMEGFSQKEIARYMRVTENTVSKWSQSGKWKERKISLSLMQDNSVQRIMELIDYQTTALKRKKDSWIDEDPDTTRLIDRGDIDALQKLFTTIRRDSKKFTDYVSVLKEFFEYLEAVDLKLAKGLTAYGDRFLNEKQKVL